MAPGFYRAIAAGVLSLHAAYIAWVIFGAFFTRGRPWLAALHVATLVLRNDYRNLWFLVPANGAGNVA